MLSNLDKYRIILASNSPRRKELLAGLDISFEVKVNGDVDESYPEGLSPEEIPMYVAQKKADAFGEQFMAAIEEFESEHARDGA